MNNVVMLKTFVHSVFCLLYMSEFSSDVVGLLRSLTVRAGASRRTTEILINQLFTNMRLCHSFIHSLVACSFITWHVCCLETSFLVRHSTFANWCTWHFLNGEIIFYFDHWSLSVCEWAWQVTSYQGQGVNCVVFWMCLFCIKKFNMFIESVLRNDRETIWDACICQHGDNMC